MLKKNLFRRAKTCHLCDEPVLVNRNPKGRMVPWTAEGYEMHDTMLVKDILELDRDFVLQHFVILCYAHHKQHVIEEEFDEATTPVR